MLEEFPSFDLGFDILNDQNNEEAGNSPGESATSQKKRFPDVTETEKNQLLSKFKWKLRRVQQIGPWTHLKVKKRNH